MRIAVTFLDAMAANSLRLISGSQYLLRAEHSQGTWAKGFYHLCIHFTLHSV